MKLKRALVSTILAGCLLGIVADAAAEQVIFVVRHAERADGRGGTMADDPPLSAAGAERAKRLAATLASADVTRIFTTELVRTRDTAAPLAEAAKVKPEVVPAKDPATLLQRVREAAGTVLVVGHSNTVPVLLAQLGVTAKIEIKDSEYDNLFVVVRPAAGEPTLIRLRY